MCPLLLGNRKRSLPISVVCLYVVLSRCLRAITISSRIDFFESQDTRTAGL